ncbi:MAG: hypothetical protein IMZ50_08510 [Candidatus Atribacteria bacterium]|nr:hypothetical protein [Candidatus Atribacteria bacterium]
MSKVARTSNVATITTSAVHGYIAGSVVKVSGVTTADFDDTWAVVVAAPSTTTFTYANAGDDVVEVADATGSVVCFGFPLRTVNSSAMTAILGVTGVWWGTSYQLKSIPWNIYIEWHTTQASSSGGDAWLYAVNGDAPTIYFWNLPTSAATITVAHIKRHSKITSAGSTDAALIVPAEYHYGIYVDGAVFAIRNRVMSPQGMYGNPDFVEALETMWGSRPEDYDTNSQARGGSNNVDPRDERHYPGTVSM